MFFSSIGQLKTYLEKQFAEDRQNPTQARDQELLRAMNVAVEKL